MAMVSRVVCVLREARQHDLAAEIAALLGPVSQAYEGDLP